MTSSDDQRMRDDRARLLHAFYRGKTQIIPRCAIRDLTDFAVWYTPGVAAPCRTIAEDPDRVYDYTNRGNCIAVVSDGTRVLGLGDIGPRAGLPVMEGKALLFKYLGGVDAVPLCLATKNADELVRTVQLIEPSFGGINLEDIASPKCFQVLDALRSSLAIPVWHDDQQGSATAALAALQNALAVVGKQLSDVRIALIGMGAANVATYRLLKSVGVTPAQIVACDSRGILSRQRGDIESAQDRFPDKWLVCRETEPEAATGGVAEALAGADVCIAFSSAGAIQPRWVQGMASGAIVFACANPVPEIWPADAMAAGARIVATGRGDFANQLNNSLVFPGLFRGVLDVRARAITDDVAIAAATAIAAFAREQGLREDYVLPRMDQWELFPRVATAVGVRAQQLGLAEITKTETQLQQDATATIANARDATATLIRAGLIAPPPAPE